MYVNRNEKWKSNLNKEYFDKKKTDHKNQTYYHDQFGKHRVSN